MRRVVVPAAVALGVALATGIGVACNVFASLDRCTTDGDCPATARCDPAGRYCAPFAADASDVDVPPPTDGGTDGDGPAPTSCDPSAPFTSFRLVAGFETTSVISARMTPDEKTVLYSALVGCAEEACFDLFVATRTDRGAPFTAGRPLPRVSCNQSSEYWPTLSADGRLLFFESGRALEPDGGACGNDRARIWSATRVSTSTDFDPPRIDSLFAVDAGTSESSPYLHPSGRSLYFVSLGRPGPGNQDIYVARIDALGLVSEVVEVSAVNTPDAENFPVISLDERTLYFARNQDVGSARDVWLARRESSTGAFAAPTRVAELDTEADEIPAWVSDDGCRLYFASNRNPSDAGTAADYRLWVAERTPR